MSRRAATFTQAEVARAIKAADQVGGGRWRVRVNRQGELIVEPFAAQTEDGAPAPPPLDRGLSLVP